MLVVETRVDRSLAIQSAREVFDDLSPPGLTLTLMDGMCDLEDAGRCSLALLQLWIRVCHDEVLNVSEGDQHESFPWVEQWWLHHILWAYQIANFGVSERSNPSGTSVCDTEVPPKTDETWRTNERIQRTGLSHWA